MSQHKDANHNRFIALADSDSESESESAAAKAKAKAEEPETFENSLTIQDASGLEQPHQPPFRTWIRDESENRFSGEEVKKNIFSSPFSKQKHVQKQWSQPRFREDADGWVSIRWNQPQFQESESPPTEPTSNLSVEYEPRPLVKQEFPSLLTRGTSNVVVNQQETMSAVAWAEKIKKSLERAELARAAKSFHNTEESVGRLSFFRRPMIVQQSEV